MTPVPFLWTARTLAEQAGYDPTIPEHATQLAADLVTEGCTPGQAQTAVTALAAEEH